MMLGCWLWDVSRGYFWDVSGGILAAGCRPLPIMAARPRDMYLYVCDLVDTS